MAGEVWVVRSRKALWMFESRPVVEWWRRQACSRCSDLPPNVGDSVRVSGSMFGGDEKLARGV